jgi:hypothetical protein
MAGKTISTLLIDSTYSLIVSIEVTHESAEMLNQIPAGLHKNIKRP